MRRVRYFVASSLDGFLARPDGSVDWLFTDQDYGREAFFATIGVAVMGRKTYDKARELGQTGFAGMENFVFSHRPEVSDKVKFVSGDVTAWLNEIRLREGKDIWLVGGGDLVRQFLEARAVDEIVLTIHPRLLGAGLPALPAPFPEMELEMFGVTPYESGLVQVIYRVTNW
jgi:dihydrofolate reductase